MQMEEMFFTISLDQDSTQQFQWLRSGEIQHTTK